MQKNYPNMKSVHSTLTWKIVGLVKLALDKTKFTETPQVTVEFYLNESKKNQEHQFVLKFLLCITIDDTGNSYST
jgi:hypothetical protein